LRKDRSKPVDRAVGFRSVVVRCSRRIVAPQLKFVLRLLDDCRPAGTERIRGSEPISIEEPVTGRERDVERLVEVIDDHHRPLGEAGEGEGENGAAVRGEDLDRTPRRIIGYMVAEHGIDDGTLVEEVEKLTDRAHLPTSIRRWNGVNRQAQRSALVAGEGFEPPTFGV
jgi:hypothetical protein